MSENNVEVESIELPCTVTRVGFRNDNGFAILYCYLDNSSVKYTQEIANASRGAIDKKYGTITVAVAMLPPEEKPEGSQYVFV